MRAAKYEVTKKKLTISGAILEIKAGEKSSISCAILLEIKAGKNSSISCAILEIKAGDPPDFLRRIRNRGRRSEKPDF